MEFTLAGVQMPTSSDVEINIARILSYIERAGEGGVDFLLFPEGALSGYISYFNQKQVESGLQQVAAACRENSVCALVGTCIRDDGEIRNQVRIFDKTGNLLGKHSKVLLTDGDLRWGTPGDEAEIFEYEGLRFGALICNDFWATPPCSMPDPHLVQQLAFNGASIIFHAINSGPSGHYLKWHEAHQELLAKVYNIYILAANATGRQPVNSPTGVVGPDGQWIKRAHRFGEQYILCELTL